MGRCQGAVFGRILGLGVGWTAATFLGQTIHPVQQRLTAITHPAMHNPDRAGFADRCPTNPIVAGTQESGLAQPGRGGFGGRSTQSSKASSTTAQQTHRLFDRPGELHCSIPSLYGSQQPETPVLPGNSGCCRPIGPEKQGISALEALNCIDFPILFGQSTRVDSAGTGRMMRSGGFGAQRESRPVSMGESAGGSLQQTRPQA